MTLPLAKPTLMFYSQRTDGRPFVNCLPYSICPVLRWMGYDVPDDYGMTLRTASGVPVAPTKGTGHADMRRALDQELPNAPISVGSLTAAELLARLPEPGKRNKRKLVASVIARMEKLPAHLRRLVGKTWKGNHAIALGGAQQLSDGSWQVYWMDPMGRPSRGYAGEWVDWTDVAGALQPGKTGIKVVYGYRKKAV